MVMGYAAPFVSDMLGVPYATLDSWVRTSFFIPSIAQAKGRGTRRLYSTFDVIILKVVTYFKNQGVHNDLLRNLIVEMREHEQKISFGSKEQVLVCNGVDTFELYKDKYEMIEGMMNGVPLWAIPIGRVKESMVNELRESNAAIEVQLDMKVKAG